MIVYIQYHNNHIIVSLGSKKHEGDIKDNSLCYVFQLKKMKFDIQKAVNNTINNISPVSGDHLRDKLQRLQNLLSGKTVDLSGRSFSISGCPRALPFCKYLIAKMIVVCIYMSVHVIIMKITIIYISRLNQYKSIN